MRANNPDLGPVALTLPDSAPDVFPTNKQNEPSIAFNAAEFTASPSASAGYHMVAGTNDEQEQPKCGPGPRRGADAPLSDCSFFPGVGTNGVYTSSNGGETWRNAGLIDDAPAWQAANYVSDGDPVIVSGPRPGANGRFSYANGARFYYVSLAHEKQASSPGGKGGNEQIVVSYNDNNGAIANWSRPVVATRSNPITFNDKNSGWVDRNPNSPYFGNLYVGFTMFRSATLKGNGNDPIGVTRSTDGGNSFGKVNQLSPAGNNRRATAARARTSTRALTARFTSRSSRPAPRWWRSRTTAASPTGGRSPSARSPTSTIDAGSNFRTDSFPNIAANQVRGRVRLVDEPHRHRAHVEGRDGPLQVDRQRPDLVAQARRREHRPRLRVLRRPRRRSQRARRRRLPVAGGRRPDDVRHRQRADRRVRGPEQRRRHDVRDHEDHAGVRGPGRERL